MANSKPRGRPFPPGTSGNPGGRPRVLPEMRQLARSLTSAALGTLADMMRNGPPNVRLAAAESLLERAWGKVDGERRPYSYPAVELFGSEDLAEMQKVSPCTNADCENGADPRFWDAKPRDAGGWALSCECGQASIEAPPREDLELEAPKVATLDEKIASALGQA